MIMKVSKITLVLLAFVGQQGYAVGDVIFKNSSGVYIVLEAQTFGDDLDVYSKVYPLGLESQTQITNFIVPITEPGKEVIKQINRMRVKYGKTAIATSAMSDYYPVDVARIKRDVHNCPNGKLTVEIQTLRHGWFTTTTEAPITTHCNSWGI